MFLHKPSSSTSRQSLSTMLSNLSEEELHDYRVGLYDRYFAAVPAGGKPRARWEMRGKKMSKELAKKGEMTQNDKTPETEFVTLPILEMSKEWLQDIQ